MCPIFLAAKLALAMSVGQSGIPVHDMTQILKQIEQYKLQFEQYKNMLKNTLHPQISIWPATESINDLIAKNEMDDLNKFKDFEGYLQLLSCCQTSSCTDADWKSLDDQVEKARKALSKANNETMAALKTSQDHLKTINSDTGKIQTDAEMNTQGALDTALRNGMFISMEVNSENHLWYQAILQQKSQVIQTAARIDRAALEASISECYFKRKGNLETTTPTKNRWNWYSRGRKLETNL